MKILYDGEIYSIFQRGGVVRYFDNLISRLPATDQPMLLGNDQPLELPKHPNLKQYFYANRWVPAGLKFVRKSLDRRYCRRTFNSINPEIIHPTYFQNVARGRFDKRKVPLVLTVYDMIHERFADEMDRRGNHSLKKREAVNRADHIICISETTRSDLIERFNIPLEKTSVTMLAADDHFLAAFNQVADPQASGDPASGVQAGGVQAGGVQAGDLANASIVAANGLANRLAIPSRPYFVFVGRRDSYKNFDRLLDGFVILKQRNHGKTLDFQLAIVGDDFSPPENEKIASRQLTDDVVHLGTVSDQALVQIYRQSLGFIFPTLWEGFGLPLLEGIAAGTCVLASDIPIFNEIAAGGFQPFDPYQAESIADAVTRIVEHSDIRQQIMQRGQTSLARYSWKTTVQETIEIYRNMIGK